MGGEADGKLMRQGKGNLGLDQAMQVAQQSGLNSARY